VIPAQSPETSWRFRVFFAAVVVTAVVLFLGAPAQAVHPPVSVLAVILSLMLFSEMSPVPLPSGGYVTATAVIDLPCLVFIGPFYTAVLDLVSTLVMQGLVQRKPPKRVIFNMAMFPITSFAAGYAFLAAGGQVGELDGAVRGQDRACEHEARRVPPAIAVSGPRGD